MLKAALLREVDGHVFSIAKTSDLDAVEAVIEALVSAASNFPEEGEIGAAFRIERERLMAHLREEGYETEFYK